MRDDAPGSPQQGMGAKRARGCASAGRLVLAGIALLMFELASPAQGRGLAVGFNWTRGAGAEQCIGPIELARSLEVRLGRALFEPAGTADLALEGRVDVDPEDGSFRAHVAVVDEPASSWAAGSCACRGRTVGRSTRL